MKRFLCLMLAITICPIFSLADLPDLSGLTHDELIELNQKISLLLFSEKLINGVEVPAGEYTVGKDIPSGTYYIEIIYPKSGGHLTVYKSEESRVAINESFLGEYWGVVKIGKIEFSDGNIVRISDNALRFFPYTGLF